MWWGNCGDVDVVMCIQIGSGLAELTRHMLELSKANVAGHAGRRVLELCTENLRALELCFQVLTGDQSVYLHVVNTRHWKKTQERCKPKK